MQFFAVLVVQKASLMSHFQAFETLIKVIQKESYIALFTLFTLFTQFDTADLMVSSLAQD